MYEGLRERMGEMAGGVGGVGDLGGDGGVGGVREGLV